MVGMEYFIYPQYDSGPNEPLPDVTLASESLRVIRFHAVAREDDGTMVQQTVCGRDAHYNPAQSDKSHWASADLSDRCPACQATIDGQREGVAQAGR